MEKSISAAQAALVHSSPPSSGGGRTQAQIPAVRYMAALPPDARDARDKWEADYFADPSGAMGNFRPSPYANPAQAREDIK